MDALKILSACSASGASLEAGKVYAVPDDISEKDAAILVKLGRAEPAKARAKAKAKVSE